MEKAAIYARVSTNEQKKHGISLDAQVARCQQHAKDEGFEVIDIRTEGLSGKDTNRPEFQEILSLVVKKKIQHVLVVKWDRVSRDDDNYVNTLRKLFIKAGCKLHCVTEGGFIDLTDDTVIFILKTRANLAWFERRRISSNTKFGMARKRELGQRISRHAPYGYKFKGDKLIVNTHEQGVIRRIHELDANGYSLRSISQTLFEEGIFNRCHKKLEAVQVWRILKKAA